ncbi:MAG: hypothetical protein K2X90_02550 [Candidatus Babeliaceae bacterium]|nr:hypothetical protein [Candidatus Babeliaceae bacterium]
MMRNMRLCAKLFMSFNALIHVLVFLTSMPLFAPITNLTNNDVYPMYSPVFPCDYLTRNERYYYIDGLDSFCQERFQIAISPFRQSADSGTDICKKKVPLGDLTGRWNIPALFYPQQYGNPEEITEVQSNLFAALDAVGPATEPVSTDLTTTCSAIINPLYSDIEHRFGFFDVDIKYRKYGLRFQFDFLLYDPIGLRVQTGFATIKQIPCFTDLTCSATGLACPAGCSSSGSPDISCCETGYTPDATTNPCVQNTACIDIYGCYCKQIMIDKVMKQIETIANTLNMNIDRMQSQGFEDTRVTLFFRRPYAINADRDDWHFFLCTPYITLDASFPTGKTPNPTNLFAVPLGNKGHFGLGTTGGVTFDFVKTVEIGFEFNVTQFFPKTHSCVPAPTYITQAGIYPETMTVKVSPGLNWNAVFSINAYHFLSRISAFFQYVFNGHDEDCFKICSATTDPANISLKRLVENSKWESNVVNVGMTYDISPNLALGFLWQSPSARRNAYKSTTVMLSIVGTF